MYRKLIFGLLLLMISIQINKCEEEEKEEKSAERTNFPIVNIKELITSEKMKRGLKSQCFNETGNDDTYENTILPELNKFSKDFTDALNITTIYRENIETKNNINAIIRQVCRNRNEALNALEEFSKSLLFCFNQTMTERFKSAENYTRKQVNGLCENDAIKLTTFIDDDGPLCFRNSMFRFRFCAMQRLGKSTSELNDLKQNNECYTLQQIRYCLVRATQTCEKPTTSQLIDSLFETMQSEIKCSNIDSFLET